MAMLVLLVGLASYSRKRSLLLLLINCYNLAQSHQEYTHPMEAVQNERLFGQSLVGWEQSPPFSRPPTTTISTPCLTSAIKMQEFGLWATSGVLSLDLYSSALASLQEGQDRCQLYQEYLLPMNEAFDDALSSLFCPLSPQQQNLKELLESVGRGHSQSSSILEMPDVPMLRLDSSWEDCGEDCGEELQSKLTKNTYGTVSPVKSSKETLGKLIDDRRIPLDEFVRRYGTSLKQGISEAIAKERLLKEGESKLTGKQAMNKFVEHLHHMENFFALLMWASAILCFIVIVIAFSDASNPYISIIVAIVNISTFVEFAENRKSMAMIESFSNFIPPEIVVTWRAHNSKGWRYQPKIARIIGDYMQTERQWYFRRYGRQIQ